MSARHRVMSLQEFIVVSKRALRNINTLRNFATVLLIAYHVIGIDPEGGMHHGYPSFWRIFADLLVDVRMPLFAFVAGVVYTLRPLSLPLFSKFVTGKFSRLVIPGVLAALVFWTSSNLLLKNGFAYGADPLSALALSMGHFWFLQAIFLIFIVVGTIDAALGYRAAVPLCLGAVVLTFVWNGLMPSVVGYLQLASAIYLAPYFLLGMVLARNYETVMEHRRFLALVALLSLGGGLMLNLQFYSDTGRLSLDRFDVQSLAFGMGIIVLSMLFFPKVDLFERLSVYAFTIYLYHPFGTSAVRKLMEEAGLDGTVTHFSLGMAVGLIFPCALHYFASQFRWTRLFMLGLRKPPERLGLKVTPSGA